MLVTNDEYEYPVRDNLTAMEAGRLLGISANSLRQHIHRGQWKKFKYRVVPYDAEPIDKGIYQKKYSLTHDRTEYFRQYHKARYKKQQK